MEIVKTNKNEYGRITAYKHDYREVKFFNGKVQMIHKDRLINLVDKNDVIRELNHQNLLKINQLQTKYSDKIYELRQFKTDLAKGTVNTLELIIKDLNEILKK